MEECEGAGVSEGGGAALVTDAGGGGFGFVAEDGVGSPEEGLDFGVEFGAGNLGEYLQGGGEGGGEGAVGLVEVYGFEQTRYEGVNLIVCATGVFGEAQDADLFGAYVVGYGSYLLVGADYDVAVGRPSSGYEDAPESGEVAADYFYFVALDELGIVGGAEGKSVGVAAGYYAEIAQILICEGEVTARGVGGGAVDYE